VTVRARERGSNRPAVTLGKGQLSGLLAAVIQGAIAFGAGLAAALVALVLGRIGYKPRPPVGLAPAARSSIMGAGPTPPPTPPPPVAAAQPPSDPLAALQQLEREHRSGTLTAEEYQARRRKVLDSL
jgi:hypothetical protein